MPIFRFLFGDGFRRSVPGVICIPLLAAMTACADGGSGTPDALESPRGGRLVIVGGALQDDNAAVYEAILAGRDGSGPLCVFPTASADPEGSLQSAVEAFDTYGGPGTAQGIDLTVENPEAAAAEATVIQTEACSGFYFVGGVQTRIVQVFRPPQGDTPAYEALLRRFRGGAVVSGSSAGAAIMTDPMIGGGTSLGALENGVAHDEEGEGVVLEKGMGFLQSAMVDQHFLARGRWARLLVAVLDSDSYDLGLGIDENTALVVDGDSAWVAGASEVVYFDTRDVVRAEGGRGWDGIRVTLLGPGDGVDLSSGEPKPDPAKSSLEASGEPFGETSVDLFARLALLRVLAQGALSSDTVVAFRQAGFEVTFRRGPGFVVQAGAGEGGEGVPAELFAGPFILGIRPEPGI